jgi:hypothetical protein
VATLIERLEEAKTAVADDARRLRDDHPQHAGGAACATCTAISALQKHALRIMLIEEVVGGKTS